MLFIVTFKLPKTAPHDPQHKVKGACPFASGLRRVCTDRTGAHHSVLMRAESVEAIEKQYRKRIVTRIEGVSEYIWEVK